MALPRKPSPSLRMGMFLCAALLSACGGTRQSPPEPPPPVVEKTTFPDAPPPDDAGEGLTDRWTADCAERLKEVGEAARALCPATFHVHTGEDLVNTSGEGDGCYFSVWLGPGHKPDSPWTDTDRSWECGIPCRRAPL